MNTKEPRKMTRRDFLIAAGCGCAGLIAVGSGCSRLGGAMAAAALVCPYGYRYDPWPGQCYRFVDANGNGYCDLSEVVAAPLVAVDEATTTSATTGVDAGRAATNTTLCDRGCRAPGQCARFVDSDGSGVCDLSEGISVSAAVTSTAPAPTAAATSSAAASTPAASAATATPTPTTTPANVGLVVLCDRGCRYPGNCGRYTDSNGTGRCDLYEGIPADQVANYGGVRGRGGRGG